MKRKRTLGILIICLLAFISGCSTKEISFDSNHYTTMVGDILELNYQANFSSLKEKDVRIEFDDGEVMRDENGNYTAEKEGTVIASLIYKGKVYDTVEIEVDPVLCKEVYSDEYEAKIGRKTDIEIQYYPENCTHRDVTLSSSDEGIFKTFGDQIIGVSEGIATLYIHSQDGPETTANVTVTAVDPYKIKIQGVRSKYYIDDSGSLSVTYDPSDVTYKEVIWSSSNKSVLSIDQDGNLYAKKKGTAEITAKCSNGVEDTVEIQVSYPPVSSISLKANYSTIYIGDKLRVRASISPQYVEDDTIKWSTSDKKIATIDSEGLVTAIAEGTVTIKAVTNNGKYASYEVKITERPVTITRSSGSGSSSSSSNGTMVWIPRTGKKYHFSKSCSNMKNPYYVTLEEAISRGFTACKKCAGG